MTPLLEAASLSKEYRGPAGTVVALRDVSLSVRPGEFLVVGGASGSGKTTLLSLLGAIATPTRGAVRFKGEALEAGGQDRLSAVRRSHFGFLFQDFRLIRHLPVLDNVLLPLVLAGKDVRQSEGRRLLGELGLSHRAGALPESLSRGEAQRAALARALIGSPAVIFADEPTASLDRDAGAAVWELLGRFNADRGVTVVAASHDPESALRASRVLRLSFGALADA